MKNHKRSRNRGVRSTVEIDGVLRHAIERLAEREHRTFSGMARLLLELGILKRTGRVIWKEPR